MIALLLRDPHGAVVARQLLRAGQSVVVGRALECALSAPDPFIAPMHLQVSVNDAGQALVQDLGSLNGTLLGQRKLGQVAETLEADARLVLGQSALELRFERAASAPEQPLAALTLQRRRELGYIGVLVVLAVLASLFYNLAQTAPESELGVDLITGLLVHAVGVAVWVGWWASITRFTQATSHWKRHLSIALIGVSLYVWLLNGIDLLAFASSRLLPNWFFGVFLCLLAALMLYGHLRAAAPGDAGRSRAGWRIALVALALPLIPTVLTFWQRYATDKGRQDGGLTNVSFWPNSLRLLEPRDSAILFENAERVRVRAADAAKGESDSADDDD